MILIVKFEIGYYILIFELNGGILVVFIIGDYVIDIVVFVVLMKEGYIFIGWLLVLLEIMLVGN